MDIEKINAYKKNAKEIHVEVGDSLENALNTLVKLHEQGEYEWYIDFNGYLFYSADIDYRSAYISYMGMTPEEHEKKLAEERQKEIDRQKRAEETAQSKLSERIIEGGKYISIYKKDAWEDLVTRLSEKGKDWNHVLDTAIKYLKLLALEDNLDINKIAEMYVLEFKSDIGDWYTSGILNIIACYSDNGPEFDLAVVDVARKVTGRKICNHKKYAKKLTDINKLNDLNVQYEEAKELVKCELYNLSYGSEFNATVIQSDINEYIGIDNNGNLILSEMIAGRLVTFAIDENCTMRIITDIDDNYSLVKINEETSVKDTQIKLVKLRRNLKTLASIHNQVKELCLNATSILAKEIMARRELSELKNDISSASPIKLIDAIMNVEENKQRKLNK